MTAPLTSSADLGFRLLSTRIAREQDVVTARHRARQIAELTGFDHQDEVRIATAVSEITRNALMYAGGGRVEFAIRLNPHPPDFQILVTDKGKGIPFVKAVLEGSYKSGTGMGLGIAGARRLMDRFEIRSEPESGTRVLLSKRIPATSKIKSPEHIAELAGRLQDAGPHDVFEELQRQNQELVEALDELRERDVQLQRLNSELEETNRGVVALYRELDDRADSLRQASEVKSRFLSHMSHEFRTPLNSILALTKLLASRTDGELTAEQDKQIGFIRTAAQELSETVNDLLDLAEVEAGHVTLHITEFSVSKLFGALRGMLRPLHSSDAVNFVFESPAADLALKTDEGKVAQILRNLISNALKFTGRGEVRVSVKRNDAFLTFAVSDTGIGIRHEEMDHIFEEFAQIDGPIQRKVKGTGLGLPLSRKLAQLLEGTLTVGSEPGVGSRFYLQLPSSVIVNGAPQAESAIAPSPSAEGTDTLLVIDDDEVSRYLVQQMLRGTRLRVTEADDGAVGLERAKFDKPRAILLDLSMPGASGFEVLEELKSTPETREIPVIIFTARTLNSSEMKALQSREAVVLSKRDVTQRALMKTLEQFLGDIGNRSREEQ